MNNTTQRLLTFFIGIPLIVSFIILDFYNHLLLNVFVCSCSIIGASEFYNMASKKTKMFPKPLILLMTGLIPILTYIFQYYKLKFDIILWIFTIFTILLMGIECFTAKTFENSLMKVSVSALILFYCGFLVSFVNRISYTNNSTFYLILYFLLVFLCDSAAWLFGILFGKNNRGFIAASPKKSIVGFVGGILASMGTAVLAKVFFPEIMNVNYGITILLGGITALSAIIGDLIESVFKRSCDTKDSGKLIPGRGGILDCMDSLVIAAPVYYILLFFLFEI